MSQTKNAESLASFETKKMISHIRTPEMDPTKTFLSSMRGWPSGLTPGESRPGSQKREAMELFRSPSVKT